MASDTLSGSGFDWRGFLKPDLFKLILIVIIPAVVALVVTGSSNSVLDFYGYLLTPRMGRWTGTEMVYYFNLYVLLWIPFYLASCTLVHLARARGPPPVSVEG